MKTVLCKNCHQEKDDHSNKGLKCPHSEMPRIWLSTFWSPDKYEGTCKRRNFNDLTCNCETCQDMERPTTKCPGCKKLKASGSKDKCFDCQEMAKAIDLAPLKERFCRDCGVILDTNKYFRCRDCSPKADTEDGDLIYNQH